MGLAHELPGSTQVILGLRMISMREVSKLPDHETPIGAC